MLNLPPGIVYNPDFFTPKDLDDAKRIVLGHGVSETKSKWIIETMWTKNILSSKNLIDKDSIVLDWGCGIGRLSKMIIEEFGCRVVGVDINQKMLDYARENVKSEKFITSTVDDFKKDNTVFTTAIAVWALQHSITPDEDLELIKNRLTDAGSLFVFEEINPTIPTDASNGYPWFILAKSNLDRIENYFEILEMGPFPTILNIPENDNAYWAVCNKKTA
jgi:SAM-dependent methyltransferase